MLSITTKRTEEKNSLLVFKKNIDKIVALTSNGYISLIVNLKYGEICIHFEVLDVYFPMNKSHSKIHYVLKYIGKWLIKGDFPTTPLWIVSTLKHLLVVITFKL